MWGFFFYIKIKEEKTMLKFEVNGPSFQYDEETEFKFKRISQKSVFQWELENSVLNARTSEERKEFSDRAQKEESNWDYYSAEEKSQLSKLGSKFCIDHCSEVIGLVDENEVPLLYEELTEEFKYLLFDQLTDNEKFLDWLGKYKAGAEKKSDSVDEIS